VLGADHILLLTSSGNSLEHTDLTFDELRRDGSTDEQGRVERGD
jgi:hypothetical protein